MNEDNVSLIRALATNSLKFKWIENQKKNLNRLLQFCSFCIHSRANNNVDHDSICKYCLCPRLLCDNDGLKGLIGLITLKEESFDGTQFLLKNLDKDLYNLIRSCLLDISSTGKISERIKHKINAFSLDTLNSLLLRELTHPKVEVFLCNLLDFYESCGLDFLEKSFINLKDVKITRLNEDTYLLERKIITI